MSNHNPPFDPRAVANLLLQEAERLDVDVTNLALQKLLYFAHGMHLNETKQPLVSGYFEAWQYGPVHPAVYSAFRAAGSSPIRSLATRIDALSGERHPIALPDNQDIRMLILRILQSFGRLSSGRLVELSHAKGAPWSHVVDKARTSVAIGLRIPDDVILERFKYHKVSVGLTPAVGEPSEDTPFA